MKRFVMGLIYCPESKRLVLLRQPDGLLNLLAGNVHDGESGADAIVRKADEELGVKSKASEWLPRGTIATQAGVGELFLRSIGLSGAHSCEGLAVYYMAANSAWAREPVVPNMQWLIPAILDTAHTHASEQV